MSEQQVAAEPKQPPPRISEEVFDRVLRLVRSRLFGQIRDEKDVSVVASVLASFLARHGQANIDWDDLDGLWPSLGRAILRHCNKHNRRAQRSVRLKLTEGSLTTLRDANVSQAVIDKLGVLKNQEYPREQFPIEVAKILEKPEWEIYQPLILQFAERLYDRPMIHLGGGAADDSKPGFEPAAEDLAMEAEVELLEFLDRFKSKLTDRERDIMELVLAQESQSTIARKLRVSQATVSHEINYIRALLEEELNEENRDQGGTSLP